MTTAVGDLRRNIRDQVTLRSQPAKLRKLFLRLGRDHRGRFDYTSFRTAIIRIGCHQEIVDKANQSILRRVFHECAQNGRMSWSDFAGKLLVLPGEGTDLSETFTGRLQGGAGSKRELDRMQFRAGHQSEIRSGGVKFFTEIFIKVIMQKGFTHPSLEILLKRNDSNHDGQLTLQEFQTSLREIGINNCAASDIVGFGNWMMEKENKGSANTSTPLSIPIALLVDLCFRDPLQDHGTGAIFFSGGGSRTHERDMSVQPRGVHVAINVVRERIASLPGMSEQGGIGRFFDKVDPGTSMPGNCLSMFFFSPFCSLCALLTWLSLLCFFDLTLFLFPIQMETEK